MAWKMRLVELRNMLVHLIPIKGKSQMVSAPCQRANHSQIMLKIISVMLFLTNQHRQLMELNFHILQSTSFLYLHLLYEIAKYIWKVYQEFVQCYSRRDLNEINNTENLVKHIDQILLWSSYNYNSLQTFSLSNPISLLVNLPTLRTHEHTNTFAYRLSNVIIKFKKKKQQQQCYFAISMYPYHNKNLQKKKQKKKKKKNERQPFIIF